MARTSAASVASRRAAGWRASSLPSRRKARRSKGESKGLAEFRSLRNCELSVDFPISPVAILAGHRAFTKLATSPRRLTFLRRREAQACEIGKECDDEEEGFR